MRVAVVGAGYVGLATSVGLCLRGHPVVLVERDPTRRKALWDRKLHHAEPGMEDAIHQVGDSLRVVAAIGDAQPRPQVVLIAVGTPSDAEGHVDLTDLRQAVRLTAAHCEGATVVIRSTVPPGTTAELAANHPSLRFAHVPEFLREGHALADFLTPTRIIIGVSDAQSSELLRALFQPFDRPILTMDTVSAELTKVASNAFLASRVALVNELARVAHHVGADVHRVRTAVGMDPRIGPHYLEPGLGFGGSCLPKDVSGLSTWSRDRNLQVPVVDALTVSNAAQMDWMVDRVPRDAKTIAVWGIAFKTGTADVRQSPALALIGRLCARGQAVDAYDPLVPVDQPLPDGAQRAQSPLESLINADFLVVANPCVPDSYHDPLLAKLRKNGAILNLSRQPSR